jgi:hypothetical protein
MTPPGGVAAIAEITAAQRSVLRTRNRRMYSGVPSIPLPMISPQNSVSPKSSSGT